MQATEQLFAFQANQSEIEHVLSALDSHSRLFAYSDYDQYKELRVLLWRLEQEFEATKNGDLTPKVTYE